MKTWKSFVALIAILGTGAVAAFGQGASPRAGTVIVPDTNSVRPAEAGLRAHTNYLIFIPARKPSFSVPTGETPGSLGCIYKIANTALYPNCPISTATAAPSGGSGIIAIVDAYDYPTAGTDFAYFSNHFGLPSGKECGSSRNLPCFTQVYATGTQPKSNSGWALEESLDIEWAHAMAPHAQIVLVEAASNSNSDLFYAVDVATNIVTSCNKTCTDGTGEVSMSWGSSESSGETAYDTHFDTTSNGVVYTAASGDSGGVVIYPSASPYVLSAGGTTINRNSSGSFTGETAWSSSGGGDSAVEPAPDYQYSVPSVKALVGSFRGTPDFSFDADPNSGVQVYDMTSYDGLTGWFIVGGTSVASPSLAGIINLAASSGGSFAADTPTELSKIYTDYNSTNYSSDFRDITSGTTSGGGGGGGPHHKSTSSSSCCSAGPGWDFMTGVGTNLGTGGK